MFPSRRRRYENKPTDLQREVIAAAKSGDGFVGAHCTQAAELLAERGYVTLLKALADGYQVELTERARKTIGSRLEAWSRFPPLR